MKKTAVVALLLAGSVFLCGGWGRGRVRAGVVIDGVEVGGMEYGEAERAVRTRIADGLAPFIVHTPAGDFAFSLSFRDDVAALVRSAKRGERLTASVERTWADAEADILSVCRANARDAEDASLRFTANGFYYTEERCGARCGYEAWLAASLAAVREGRTEICFAPLPYPPKVTAESLRARTRLLASFRTRYDAGNAARAHNIELSAARISGSVVEAGGEFSFNKTVGKRTAANGFLEANIILDGEFVPGVGGGVCQTSTTLFNAALRAGMRITESRAHSLSVSYVPPSLDAMVSDGSDLKFVNPYGCPVYILAAAGGGEVCFEFYGAPDGKRYVTESRVLSYIEPPPEEIVEGEESRILRAAREGVKSESYLSVYENGALLSRTLVRKDTYACVRGKRQVGREPQQEETDGETAENSANG